jgi:ABC-2 type transport system permease protein
MNSARVIAIVYRHGYDIRRNLNRITETVYWPFQNILVWGLFTIYLAREHGLQPGLVTFLLGAITLWGMFYSFQRDMATGFMEEIFSRNLINLFSTPVTITEYLAGMVIISLIKALAGILVSVLLAWVCYATNLCPALIRVMPFLLVLLLFSICMGLIVTALIVRFGTKLQTLAWSLAGLLMPVSCVFYPVTTLPRWLQPIAMLLPTTHAFEGMRELLAGAPASGHHLAWGLGLDGGYLVLASVLFRAMFLSARARGLLIRPE